jgi:hypothetical protein
MMAEAQKPATFVVDGVEYAVPEKFNLGEMCDAETFFGVDLSKSGNNARAIAASLYIAIRRVNEDVTPDDIRAMDLEEVEVKMAEGAQPDPSTLEAEQKPNDSSATSGDDSRNGGGDPERIPAVTGQPPSATPAT